MATCNSGKRGYPNEGAARLALMECRSRGRCERRYYQCNMCQGWHLTSQALLPKAA